MILIIFLFSLFSNVENIESHGCLEMDIILLGDLSGSIDGSEQFVADALEAFVSRFDLGENTLRIGAATFSWNIYEISQLTHDKKKLLTGIDYLRTHRMGATTRMSNAIDYASEQFSKYGRPGVKKMVIIISDGAANQPKNTVLAIKNLVEKHRAFICGVYVWTPSGGDEDFMFSISNEACFVSSSYEILVEELERLDICL